MKILHKIRSFLSLLALSVLKRSLRYRLEGDGKQWLQEVGREDAGIYNREEFILDKCKGKKVLHIGFSDYPFTRQRVEDGSLLHLSIKKVAKELMGIDNNRQAIEEYYLLTNDPHTACVDITNTYPTEIINGGFDIILLTEVLEHIPDVYTVVDQLYNCFSNGMRILVTVPNYSSLDSLAASLNKTESIHPHHHWYFSPFTLRKLFEEKRFTMESMQFGMYFRKGIQPGLMVKRFPYTGDCIMAVFSILKKHGI